MKPGKFVAEAAAVSWLFAPVACILYNDSIVRGNRMRSKSETLVMRRFIPKNDNDSCLRVLAVVALPR